MFVEIEKILITAHDVVRRAFEGALEVAIIGLVVADDGADELAVLIVQHEP